MLRIESATASSKVTKLPLGVVSDVKKHTVTSIVVYNSWCSVIVCTDTQHTTRVLHASHWAAAAIKLHVHKKPTRSSKTNATHQMALQGVASPVCLSSTLLLTTAFTYTPIIITIPT